MISLSDALMENNGIGLRPVLPLEFQDIEELNSVKPVAAPVVMESESEEMEALAELEERLRSQSERNDRQIERARQSARIEAREELEQEFEDRLAAERASIAAACEQFSRERRKYFTEVEAEVVRLTLAIAARVLHRESQLDPLLLRGVVRVALERLQEDGSATLRVPPDQAAEWNVIVTNIRDGVVVMGDVRISSADCVLETTVGRVELGVKAQMEEIEKGFFDLLQQRPA